MKINLKWFKKKMCEKFDCLDYEKNIKFERKIYKSLWMIWWIWLIK